MTESQIREIVRDEIGNSKGPQELTEAQNEHWKKLIREALIKSIRDAEIAVSE